MSRNFEVLRQRGKEAELSELSGIDWRGIEARSPQLDEVVSVERDGAKQADEDLLFEPCSLDSPRSHEPHQPDQMILTQEEVIESETGEPPLRFATSLLPNASHALTDLSEAAQEQVIKLVQRVFVFPNSSAPRLVIFSSIDKSSASSELCFHAGRVLAAQVSGSVCLVDANFRAPSLYRFSRVGQFPGLSDAAMNPGPIKYFAVQIAGSNLWVLPPGSHAVEAPRLFAWDRLCARIAELGNEFDYVLIDAPAVSFSTDAVLLGQRADGVVLVVEANSTRRELARTAKETLQAANVKLLGAILNNRTFPIPEALYRKL